MDTYTIHIPPGHPNRPGDKLIELRGLVVHYTANDKPGAGDREHALGYLRRPWERGEYIDRKTGKRKSGIVVPGTKRPDGTSEQFRLGSAHRFVDHDSRTETIPLDERAYGAGDDVTSLAQGLFAGKQNWYTLHWEMCNNDAIPNSDEDWELTKANALQDMAAVIKELNLEPVFDTEAFAKTWWPARKWPKNVVLILRHFDLSGKLCPLEFVRYPAEWQRFKEALKALL